MLVYENLNNFCGASQKLLNNCPLFYGHTASELSGGQQRTKHKQDKIFCNKEISV